MLKILSLTLPLLLAATVSLCSFKAFASCESDMSVPGPWDSTRNQRLITLLIDNGIDFRPGDNVFVTGPRYQTEFINAVAAELKKRGAGKVLAFTGFDREDVKASFARGESPEDFVKRHHVQEMVDELVRGKYSKIAIEGSNVLGLPEGVKPEDWAKLFRTVYNVYAPAHDLAMSNQIPWTVAELPTPLQASLVAPDLSADEALATLKKMVADVYLLDEPNISERWRQSSEAIEARSEKLNQLQIKKLHYKSSQTNFTVELHERAMWEGGRVKDFGRVSQPNFPTFENYVTPLKLSTNGRIQVVRAVPIQHTLVRGAWFQFENGKVVDYGASEGKEALDRFFDQDPNTRYLGEVALVDADSPVNQHPRAFYSIVFDENALSHVALGGGYPTTFTEPKPASEQDYEAVGMNSPETMGHIDFMIGSPDMDITAETYDGRLVTVMRKGKLILK